jgi:hypothetical protein
MGHGIGLHTTCVINNAPQISKLYHSFNGFTMYAESLIVVHALDLFTLIFKPTLVASHSILSSTVYIASVE